MIEVQAILQSVITELEALETVIAALTNDPTKVNELQRKIKLEYKEFLLKNRKEIYVAVALAKKKLDLQGINKELDEVDVFLVAINARKVVLKNV